MILLNHGASVKATDQLGETPLHNAAYKANYATCELLLQHGADPNYRSK